MKEAKEFTVVVILLTLLALSVIAVIPPPPPAPGIGGGSTFTLTITKSGDGTGNVNESGNNIACGITCSAVYNSGDSITLTATPILNSAFTGWSGDCTGTDPCSLTMSADKDVTATFVSLPDTPGAPGTTTEIPPDPITPGDTTTTTGTTSTGTTVSTTATTTSTSFDTTTETSTATTDTTTSGSSGTSTGSTDTTTAGTADTTSSTDSSSGIIKQPAQQKIAQEPVIESPEPTKSNIPFYIGIVLVVVVLSGGAFAYLKLKAPTENPQVLQLRNYIQENMKKGYSKEQLTATLVRSGYPMNIIDKALGTQQTSQLSPQVSQLKTYIQENMKKGYSKEQLAASLRNSGYQQNIIDEAMKNV